jgi:hypothetical protein
MGLENSVKLILEGQNRLEGMVCQMSKEQNDLKELAGNLLENQARMSEELRKLVFKQDNNEIQLLNVNKFFSLQ